MSRISDTATEQVFADEGGGFLELLVIDHSTLADPLRFVNNTENIVSNGETYIAYPFTIKLPTDQDGAIPAATLVIDNVSREIGQTIRLLAANDPPTVSFEIIRMDDLDVVEQSFPTFLLRNARYNGLTVTGDLKLTDLSREPFPQRYFTPAEYPGLF